MVVLAQEERKQIVDLYQKGLIIADVAKQMHRCTDTVRTVLIEEGVFVRYRPRPKEEKTQRLLPKVTNSEYEDMKLRESIRTCDVLDIRNKVKAGDTFLIRTEKGFKELGDDVNVAGKTLSGVIRKAVVTNTSNPRFCLLKLESGVMESVLWRDLAIAQRKGKICVN